MTDLYVTISGQFTDGNGDYASGNWAISASGTLVSNLMNAISVPFIDGQLDSLGALSVPPGAANSGIVLLASDNADFSPGDLTYDFKIEVQGIASIIAQNIAVNNSLGASQSLFGCLEAAGWTPASD